MTFRNNILLLGLLLTLIAIGRPVFAYQLDAEMIEPNSMIFPIGQFIPEDLSNADDIDFQSIRPIFRMKVEDDNPADPDNLILMIRLEVAGGDPIFTVTSSPLNIRVNLADDMWRTNTVLSVTPGIELGQADDINAANILPYIDGGNMVDNLYVLTALLADPTYSSDQWDSAVEDNYGIVSASTRVRNPSQVTLMSPVDFDEIYGNPVFKWTFPRNPGVKFRLVVVSGEEDEDATSALDFANESTTYLDTTFSAGMEAGEQTIYTYTGIGGERPLDRGVMYHWRVVAKPLTMFGESDSIASVPASFSFGFPPPIEVTGPADNAVTERPTMLFSWSYPPGFGMEEIQLVVVKEDILTGEEYGRFTLPVYGGVSSYNVTYRAGLDGAKDMTSGEYQWKLIGTGNIDGAEYTIESPVRSFRFDPKFEIVSPGGFGRRVYSPRAQINFRWQTPDKFRATSYDIVVDQTRINLPDGTSEDSDKTWSTTANGNETSLGQNVPQFIRDMEAGEYTWSVTAYLPDGETQFKTTTFSIVYPRLELGIEGEIYTPLPRISWGWYPDPQQSEYKVSLTTADFGTVFKTVDVRNGTSWQYDGDSLEVDVEYGIIVEGNPEVSQFNTARSTITYTSDPEATVNYGISLGYPRNGKEIVDGGRNVNFDWRFPELGEDYELSFELHIVPQDVFTKDPDDTTKVPDDVVYVETTIVDLEGDARRIGIDDLTLGYKYEWYVVANYKTLKGEPRQVESDHREFFYDPTLWSPNSPQSRILGSLGDQLPEELMTLINRLRQQGYHFLGDIRVDGQVTDLDGLIQVLSEDGIEFVQMNITQ